jgi:Coenzyme PQQ synthesis protein D (PqqD)
MGSVTITKDSVLIRALGVNTRVTEQVADMTENADCGALLETMLGRYVLDRDGRAIWLLLDGRRSVDQIVDALAAADGLPAAQLGQPVRDFCARLTELGLVELADGADR